MLIITGPKGIEKEKLARNLCLEFPDFLGNV